MAPAHHFKNLENKYFFKIKNFFRTVSFALVTVFRVIIQWGRQKFTVMLIPHTEKKVFNFKISVFTLIFTGILVALLLAGFFILSTHFTGTNKRYTDASLNLQSTEEVFESLTGEIANLRKAVKPFRESLEKALSVLDTDNTRNFFTSGTGGDLSSLITVEEYESRGLPEIDYLRRLSVDLQNAIKPIEEFHNLLESHVYVLANIPTLWPLINMKGRITQLFGPAIHPFTGDYYMHKGVDIAWGYNVPIVSTADGQVVKVDRDDLGLGIHVEIKHKYSFSTRYGHFNKVIVGDGQIVEGGEIIGYMGNTGLSDGPHLHYEVKLGGEVVDPIQFLNIRSPLGQNNRNVGWD